MSKYFDQAVKETQALVAILSVQGEPAENAPFGVEVDRALQRTLSLCSDLGFRTENLDGFAGVAEVGEGQPFGILGHLDVVPVGKGWAYPHGEIVNGVLYGRGVLDDKAPMILCLYAVKRLLDEGAMPTRKIRFIFGCNEESGWGCIEHYNKVAQMPKEGFSPDADFPVIYCEKGIVHYALHCPINIPSLKVFSAGERVNVVPCMASARFSALSTAQVDMARAQGISVEKDGEDVVLTAYGKNAHGSRPQDGENAAMKLIKFLSEAFNGYGTQLYNALRSYDGSGLGLKISDDVSGELTLNVGTVRLVGDVLTLGLDIRYPISYAEDFIQKRLESAFEGATVKELMKHAPLYVAKDAPLVTQLLSAYKRVTGDSSQPISIGGGTYARALPLGVAFGPILPGMTSTIHEVDERASLADLRTIYDIYYEAIKACCFSDKAE